VVAVRDWLFGAEGSTPGSISWKHDLRGFPSNSLPKTLFDPNNWIIPFLRGLLTSQNLAHAAVDVYSFTVARSVNGTSSGPFAGKQALIKRSGLLGTSLGRKTARRSVSEEPVWDFPSESGETQTSVGWKALRYTPIRCTPERDNLLALHLRDIYLRVIYIYKDVRLRKKYAGKTFAGMYFSPACISRRHAFGDVYFMDVYLLWVCLSQACISHGVCIS
jgi:hypothetical protein